MNADIERALRDAAPLTDAGAAADAARRLSDRAVAEGLADVTYATVDSPLGPLVAARTERGLVRLAYGADASLDVVLADLAARVSPRVLESPARLDEVRRELDEYFSGRRRDFGLAVDWSLTRSGFTREILQSTATLGFGETSTYRDMAARVGRPAASRATGNALGSNPIPIVVPCHRVLRTGGGLGGYTGGIHRKELLLELEGVLAPGR